MPASASDGFVSPLPPTGRRGLRFASPVVRRSNLDFRRGGDSNPRYPLGVQLLSREPDSAALAPLPYRNRRRGAGGIRSSSLASCKLPRTRLRPLSAASCRLFLASLGAGSASNPLAALIFTSPEQEGFEPSVPCGTAVFKTASLDHSDTAPVSAVAKHTRLSGHCQ